MRYQGQARTRPFSGKGPKLENAKIFDPPGWSIKQGNEETLLGLRSSPALTPERQIVMVEGGFSLTIC
jgi:hypothetical protein